MSAGKGDMLRAVNGEAYRRNFDRIFRRPYPEWICYGCRLNGKRPEGNPYGATWHIDTCGLCGTGGIEVTECRDFGHLKEGWDK